MSETSGSFLHSRGARLATLTFGHFVVDMYAGFCIALIPELSNHLGEEVWKVTALVGACGVLVNMVQPPAGWALTRASRGVFLIMGILLAMCAALIGLAGSFVALALLMLTAHVGIGVYHPGALTSVLDMSGARDHLGVPVFMSGGFIGWSVGAAVATQWVYYFGFEHFYLLALPAMALLALCVLTGLHRRGRSATRAAPDRAVSTGPAHLAIIMVLGLMIGVSITVLYMFLKTDLEARFGKEGLKVGGNVIAALGLSAMAGSFFWGHLSVRFSPYALIAVGQLIGAALYLPLIRSSGGHMILLGAVAGFFLGAAFFPLVATMAGRARQLTMGTRLGLIVGVSWGAGSLTAILCGYLIRLGVTAGEILHGNVLMVLGAACVALVLYAIERRSAR
ncbi:MAG: hypothetical protein J7M14_07525 [Planctomycetes bacterium]|nr:hypothetical protein [Planctomycetota bacterium]